MNPHDLIRIYYRPGTLAHEVMILHCEAVAAAAVAIARRVPHLRPDPEFVREAAMLHDIGAFETDAPGIGCFGSQPYLCHGYLGRALLENHGLPNHARVCERHIGTGLSAADISARQLPLPKQDMLPETVEEQIICFADTFFSKTPAPRGTRRSADAVIEALSPYGGDKVERFCRWLELFGSVE